MEKDKKKQDKQPKRNETVVIIDKEMIRSENVDSLEIFILLSRSKPYYRVLV